MDTVSKQVMDGLSKAIQMERDGSNFYVMAASHTDDPRGREVFETLSKEELSHEEFLKKKMKSIMETGKVDETVKITRGDRITELSPIFSKEIRDRINEAHYEMTALSIGIQLELNSINFYKKEAESVSDPVLKDLYKELADWESEHYHALLSEEEELKEDYWESNNFYPF